MNLRIYTHDSKLVSDLFGKKSPDSGDEVQITDQIKLKYKHTTILLSEGFPPVYTFIISFLSGVAANVLAKALWEKLKGRKVAKLLIDRTEVKFEEGEIIRIFQEKIKTESD